MIIGLEFGCGEDPRKPEFDGVDVRALPTVKYVCDAWDIHQHVDAQTVDEIYSRHFFEHLTFHQGDITLQSWLSVLKPGGMVEMIVPNMLHHIEQWLHIDRQTTEVKRSGASPSTYESEAIKGFWGGQRGDWDFHKSGYDLELLKNTVTRMGYVDYTSIKSAPKNLHVVFRKPL
jgi:predicted SAM-dependent methyltransferase